MDGANVRSVIASAALGIALLGFVVSRRVG